MLKIWRTTDIATAVGGGSKREKQATSNIPMVFVGLLRVTHINILQMVIVTVPTTKTAEKVSCETAVQSLNL
jgi:hypothetical protein